MTTLYYDTSVFLNMLLGQEAGEEAAQLWDRAEHRISSRLFEIESLQVIRRQNKKRKEEKVILENLDQGLEEISLFEIDDSIYQIIRREATLGSCRTLDAIHLATALVCKNQSEGQYFFASFDLAQRKAANQLGLAVLPDMRS